MQPVATIASAALLALAACAPAAETPAPVANPIIEAYTAAYNTQDLAAMQGMMHPDIEWISLEGSEAIIYTSGRDQLVAELESYFASSSQSQSDLAHWATTGPYISVTERIVRPGQQPGEDVSAARAVYELEDGLIRRVWYYPAVIVTLD